MNIPLKSLSMSDLVLYKVITDIIKNNTHRFTESDIKEIALLIKNLDIVQKLAEYLITYILKHTNCPYTFWDLNIFIDILNTMLQKYQIDTNKLIDIKNNYILSYNERQNKLYAEEKNEYIVQIAQKNIEKDTRIQAIEHIQQSLTFYYTSENISKVEKLKSEILKRDESISFLKHKIDHINFPLYDENKINTINL